MLRLLASCLTPRWIVPATVAIIGLLSVGLMALLLQDNSYAKPAYDKLECDNSISLTTVSVQSEATLAPVIHDGNEFTATSSGEPKLEKATFMMLVRNSEVHDARSSIRYVEDRFNKNFHYPWLFINDEPFSSEFVKMTRSLVSGNATYGVVPKEAWSMPNWIDRQKAEECMKTMESHKIPYGGMESYRHMCRFFSGFFYRHELLAEYDYYWRVEPNTQLYCDITYDPFTFMREKNKTYGFTITLHEHESTIETLWSTVQNFSRAHPEHIHANNALDFIVDDQKSITEGSYNFCHFWSNFEIASLKFFRSQAYGDFFDALDRSGGFFYERWGDAPVHSIAAALMVDKAEIHWFYDVGYRHQDYMHCPEPLAEFHDSGKCFCNPDQNVDGKSYSCAKEYQRMCGDQGGH
ncbi:nucleotide-diphospho-sugar transferase [Lipomyces starkeyi]